MKRLVAATISAGLLALLFWQIDTAALAANLRATRWGLFALAMALFVPQILVIALRWKRLVAPFAPLPLGESTRMVLAGATMNLVLPGKMGDLTKGWFLAKAGAVSPVLGLGVVIFEKMLDVAMLALFMLGGVVLILTGAGTEASVAVSNTGATTSGGAPVPMGSLLIAMALGLAAVTGVAILYFVQLNRVPGMNLLIRLAGRSPRFIKIQELLMGSHRTMDALRARGARRGEIIGLSFAIWALHLAQIYLFFLCLGAAPGPGEYFTMVPLAIFIGLLPISIAGFGTRDAALVALLPNLPASAVLAAALYINLRYIMPAAAGVPFLARFSMAKSGRDQSA